MTPIIEARDLVKRYEVGGEPFLALRGVSLTLGRGEFLAIMGASGSGKSTLLHLLGCLDRPDGGRYLLNGVDVRTLDDSGLAAVRGRLLGFVFQSFNLLARTSALENVELPLIYSGWTAAGRARARRLLATLGLEGRFDNQPNQLSGGEQQRVAIARALINRPLVLLADEPTGNLDSRNAAEVLDLLRTLCHEQGLTIVMVTHDAEVARSADRTITLRDGLIVTDQLNPRTAPAAPPTIADAVPSPPAAIAESGAWRALAAMILLSARRSLGRNRLRAGLTMLGVLIGVAAVVLMMAIGQGTSAVIQQRIRSLGTNMLTVHPGTTIASGVRVGSGSNSKLTVGDARAIGADDAAIGGVAYVIRQAAQVVNEDRNWSTVIVGTGPEYFTIRDWGVTSGRIFNHEEARTAATVCLLGQTVATNLFDTDDPVGASIRIKNVPFRVIGVLAPKGATNEGQDQDDAVMIPFTTAERRVLGSATAAGGGSAAIADPGSAPAFEAHYNVEAVRNTMAGQAPRMLGKVNIIYAQAVNAGLIDSAIDELTATLRERHGLKPRQDDDFTVHDMTAIAQASASTSRMLTMLLAALASIALVVGGVGIMNIMLVSVTERTREIGIRLAVGAQRTHILAQFLAEAVLLSLAGGLAGVVLGVLGAVAVTALDLGPTVLSFTPIVGSLLFSAAVGVFFGYYPAKRAALLKPIEALRYE